MIVLMQLFFVFLFPLYRTKSITAADSIINYKIQLSSWQKLNVLKEKAEFEFGLKDAAKVPLEEKKEFDFKSSIISIPSIKISNNKYGGDENLRSFKAHKIGVKCSRYGSKLNTSFNLDSKAFGKLMRSLSHCGQMVKIANIAKGVLEDLVELHKCRVVHCNVSGKTIYCVKNELGDSYDTDELEAESSELYQFYLNGMGTGTCKVVPKTGAKIKHIFDDSEPSYFCMCLYFLIFCVFF